jgi:hypothetical protein
MFLARTSTGSESDPLVVTWLCEEEEEDDGRERALGAPCPYR